MIDENKLQLFRMQADICKTMADPKRLMIVHELREGELPVGELAARLELPQANISQHLSLMRKRGIVTTRREGTSIYYSLASKKIADACDTVQCVLAEQLEGNRKLAKLLDAV
jgi:DNA-binding transcriptional ArsR family regulator